MRLMILALLAITFASCTDAEWARRDAYSSPHTIELYSGGRVVASFKSTGKVECSEGGICDWMDASTGKLVRTSGDIVIRVE
jgi:hypothetical protein